MKKRSIEMVQDRIDQRKDQVKVWDDYISRNENDIDSKFIKTKIELEITWLELLLIQMKDER
jgi:hypothetical protein